MRACLRRNQLYSLGHTYIQSCETDQLLIFSLRKSEDRTTGMFVMQIETPNGFMVDVEDQKQDNKDAQHMHYENGQLNVYFKHVSEKKAFGKTSITLYYLFQK